MNERRNSEERKKMFSHNTPRRNDKHKKNKEKFPFK